jgi:hypothetical protein
LKKIGGPKGVKAMSHALRHTSGTRLLRETGTYTVRTSDLMERERMATTIHTQQTDADLDEAAAQLWRCPSWSMTGPGAERLAILTGYRHQVLWYAEGRESASLIPCGFVM